MQTSFTAEQLADPKLADANTTLRKCVHCGFCTATCPTYVLLGDELDSPRGRIYLIKEMLEQGKAADASTVKHIDRCLSCLSCMTTCPSGVNYMHLIDQARAHVEKTYNRTLGDRFMRWLLDFVMTRPTVFRLSLAGAALARPLAPVLQAFGLKRMSAMLSLAPATLPRPLPDRLQPAKLKRRVGLLKGCVQSVMDPGINDATVRLLNRFGIEVIESTVPCCGSLSHHMGKEDAALAHARAMIDAFAALDVEAIVITASGCGTTIKDYGHMLQHDAQYAEKAARVAGKALDVTEFLAKLELPTGTAQGRVSYHSACSMQHGQRIKTLPQALLRRAGFTVSDVPDGHLCCGSAGTYNMLQPEIATRLRDKKISDILTTAPEIIATGNIGCMTQLATVSPVPLVHTVELLDWAYGGPRPDKLNHPLA
jgi:glycolate oxidase iron-sulfur subunit